MSEGTSGTPSIQRIDLRTVEEWQTPPRVEFEKVASLTIAKWVLAIFGGVYAFSFVLIWQMLSKEDASFVNAMEILKFLVQSVLPLVTLAVGYYLGDRSSMAKSEQ
jgi:hypothetical protein